MNVSVVITCFNEERHIGPCLESLQNQDYDGGQVEIIVCDGGSTDRTQAIAAEFGRGDPRIRVVVEPKPGTAAGRNAGIRAAAHDYLAFIDADCVAPREWLGVLCDAFRAHAVLDPGLAGVGGANIPPVSADAFVQAIGVALDSYVGSFTSAQGRRFKRPVLVEGLANCNVLYDRERLIAAGLYDESLRSEAEDADMNFRMRKRGGRFLFIPDSFVWHHMRPTAKGWWRNMFRYGKGRARLLKRYREMWAVSFVLPPLFLGGMALAGLAPVWPVMAAPLLYFPLIFFFSFYQCLRKKTPRLALNVALIYIIQHFGYAAGETYGLLSPGVK